MADEERNTWGAKLKRTLTSVLPVSGDRKGQCVNCGACCRLPNDCKFIKTNGDGKIFCAIYPVRPLNCRKYPRSKSELITAETCGYSFD